MLVIADTVKILQAQYSSFPQKHFIIIKYFQIKEKKTRKWLFLTYSLGPQKWQKRKLWLTEKKGEKRS